MEHILPKKGLVGGKGILSEFDFVIIDEENGNGIDFDGVISLYDNVYSRFVFNEDSDEYEESMNYHIVDDADDALDCAASDLCLDANGNPISDEWVDLYAERIAKYPEIAKYIIKSAIEKRLSKYGGIHTSVPRRELAENICNGVPIYVVDIGEVLDGEEFGMRLEDWLIKYRECTKYTAEVYHNAVARWVKSIKRTAVGNCEYVMKDE